MINRIIDFQRQKQVHRLRPGGRRLPGGLVVHEAHDPGRHPGLERHPGHHLFPLGPQPGHHRRPGDLPHRLGHGGRAEGEGRARFFRFRLLLRLRHLRGRHGHLLGQVPHPGIPFRRPAAPARRRQNRDGAGCHPPGLDLPVRPGGQVREAQPGRSALLPGLVPQVLSESGAGRGRGGPGRAGSASSTR